MTIEKSKTQQVYDLFDEGMTDTQISKELSVSRSWITGLRGAFNAGRARPPEAYKPSVTDNEGGNGKKPSKKQSKKAENPDALLITTSRDEEVQQLIIANKAKRMAVPELLYTGMYMSRRVLGWQSMNEADFIDTVIYSLFKACGVRLHAALIESSNTVLTRYEEEELSYAPIGIGGDDELDEQVDDQADEETGQGTWVEIPASDEEEKPFADLYDPNELAEKPVDDIDWDAIQPEPREEVVDAPGVPMDLPISEIIRRNLGNQEV